MGGLGRRALGAALGSVIILALFGLAAGLVRLLPWLVSPEVPLDVSLPFARALGAGATEMAFLIGAPLGTALAVARFVERGEARALHALGVTPARIARSLFPELVAVGLLALAASFAWGSSADVPGRFARDLVREARTSCARASAPKSAAVPLLGVTWLCFPGEPPRVTGTLPGTGGALIYTATDLSPSDDLRAVELSHLRVHAKKLGSIPLELAVESGVVRGLPGWGRSAKLPALVRNLLASGSAIALGLLAAHALLAHSLTRRSMAVVLGAIPSVTALVTLSRLDASTLPGHFYWLVPLSAVVTSVVLRLVLARFFLRVGAAHPT